MLKKGDGIPANEQESQRYFEMVGVVTNKLNFLNKNIIKKKNSESLIIYLKKNNTFMSLSKQKKV